MKTAIRARVPDVGVAFFDAMTLGGGMADVHAYTQLIKVHAAAGRVAEALAVERRMSAEQVAPSVHTYTTLMAVCGRAGDRRGMLKYFQQIGDKGMRATVHSWNVVLDFCAKRAPAPPRCCVFSAGLRARSPTARGRGACSFGVCVRR